jgi:hypothetical protein
MNRNNGNHRMAGVDVIEDNRSPEQITSTFYDSNNPELKPPKQINVSRWKGWKRKLMGWCFVLLLIFAGAVALYLLLRVNRVDVKVQADSRRGAQSTTPNANSSNPDNTLTAEAINIARSASGSDNSAVNASPSASPSTSASPSPSPIGNVRTNYSFTGNTSPVFEPFTDSGSSGNNSQQTNAGLTENSKALDLSTSLVAQNHANITQSIFVGEEPARSTSTAQSISAAQLKTVTVNKRTLANATKTPPAVLPPFGTMLPVRTQGMIFTLRTNSYARMELTRDIAGEGWSLPKGTVFVGRTSGNEYDRAFVNVIGYIDPRDNKLVKMTGDVMGVDGASGIQGKRIGLDRNRLKQTLRKVASSGVQVAGMMAGALTGRGTVVIDGAGYRLINPITNDARGLVGTGAEKNTFVKVEAGRPAYVMVADLPKSVQVIDAPGDEELAQAANSLTDREVMELILFGSPEEIRAALPLMTDEQKRLGTKGLTPEVYK